MHCYALRNGGCDVTCLKESPSDSTVNHRREVQVKLLRYGWVQYGNFNFLRLSEMEPVLVSLSVLAGKQLKGRCQVPAVLKSGDVWKRFFLLKYENRCHFYRTFQK